jgi:hypothetical protein
MDEKEREGEEKRRKGRGMSMPIGSCCGATGRVADKEMMRQGHKENSGCLQIVGLYRGGVTNSIKAESCRPPSLHLVCYVLCT